jgi:glycine betaine/choline ABC-type transport system substrate-binding protein
MNRRTAIAALGGLFCAPSCKKAPRPVTAGAKDFTEQRILTEIIALHVERRLGDRVVRRTGFEGTRAIHQALMLREIDLYPEYTGTEVVVAIGEVPDTDPSIVLERVRRYVEQNGVVAWLNPLGLDNPFAISVPGDIARQNKLVTLEDAAGYKPGWALTMLSEFQQRRDGYGALMQNYSIPMRSVPVVQPASSLYQPIEQNRCDMVAGRLTDSMLAAKDLVVLKDVRKAFAPSAACITVRNDTLAAYPSLRGALEELSGKFTTAIMRALNTEVDNKRRDARDVAAEFLESARLI